MVSAYDLEKIPFRPLVYAIAMIYLLCDWGFEGPVTRNFARWRIGSEYSQKVGVDNGWARSVNGMPITKAQLDLGLDIYLARRGKIRQEFTPKNLLITQLAVLNRMTDDEIVRQWAVNPRTKDNHVEVPKVLLDARIEQFEAGFPPGKLGEACKAQGLSEAEYKKLIRSHFYQDEWLKGMTDERSEIFDERQAQWFGDYKEKLVVPEVVRARHIFLSTVENDSPEREALIRQIHTELTGGGDFEALAKLHSEDERSKPLGGDLGYFSRNRLQEDFTEPAFALNVGERSEPFRTKLGWHIVETLERLPQRSLTFDELKPEIAIHLENEKRRKVLDYLMKKQLRIKRRARIETFPAAYELIGIELPAKEPQKQP